MNFTKAVKLQAFLNVLRQEDSLPPELALTLNRIGSQLETDPDGAISELVKLARNSHLKEKYEEQRDRLKSNRSEIERNRGAGRDSSMRQTHPGYRQNEATTGVDDFSSDTEQESSGEKQVSFLNKLKNMAMQIFTTADPVSEAKQKDRELSESEAYLCETLR